MIVTKIGTPERLIRAAQEELIQSHGLLEMQAVAKRAKVLPRIEAPRRGVTVASDSPPLVPRSMRLRCILKHTQPMCVSYGKN